MRLPKGSANLVLSITLFSIIVLLAFLTKASEWCNESLNSGDCKVFEINKNCYCIDDDRKHPANLDEGIYSHSQLRCEALNGTLAVTASDSLLQWLSKRMYHSGIDNALVGLRKMHDQWYWMHPMGPLLATDIQWRSNINFSSTHDYATINVETIEVERQEESKDGDYLYYNYKHYIDQDPTFEWYGFSTSDNLFTDQHMITGAYYICQYASQQVNNHPQVSSTTTSDSVQAVQQESSNKCTCEDSEQITLSYLDDSETFTSPRYPSNYCSDLNCRWMVSAPPGLVVKFETLVFHVEKTFDFLYIYDGPSSTENPLMASCTGSFCSDLKSSSNQMQVHFSADHVTTDLGFKIRVTAVDSDPCFCSQLVKVVLVNLGDSFGLYSPNYPSPYCTNHDCRWTISTINDYGLHITWNMFSLEAGQDFLYVYDGEFSTDNSLAMCTGDSCQDMITSGKDIHIHFTSNQVHSIDSGFFALITVDFNCHRIVLDFKPASIGLDCENITHPHLPVKFGGEQRADGNIPIDGTATITCVDGSKVTGTVDDTSDTVVCTAGAKWNRELGNCTTVCKLEKMVLAEPVRIEHICTLEEPSDSSYVSHGHALIVDYYDYESGHKNYTQVYTCDHSKWSPGPEPPVCHAPWKGIFLFGGAGHGNRWAPLELYSPFETPGQEIGFDLHVNIWSSTLLLPNGSIFIMGGLSTENTSVSAWVGYGQAPPLSSTQLVDPFLKTVTNGPELNAARLNAGAAILDGRPVICGGDTVREDLSSCEMLIEDKWQMIKPMRFSRTTVTLVALEHDLFAIGGTHQLFSYSSIQENVIRKLVERYTQGQWREAPSLNNGRFTAAAAIFQNQIIICGGDAGNFRKFNMLNSCESYKKGQEQWHEIAAMNRGRTSFTLVVFSGRLFAMGGDNSVIDSTNSVERYDHILESWVNEEKSMIHKRSHHSAIAFPPH